MRFPALSFALAVAFTLVLPARLLGIVLFGRVDELHAQPCWPEALKPALESRSWIAGTTFDGWGTNRIELFYKGDADEFAAFLKTLQAVPMLATDAKGQFCSIETSLTLTPGRGHVSEQTVKRHGLGSPFNYDWSVAVNLMYDDQRGRAAPFVTTVTDAQGRTVRRRGARTQAYRPNVRIYVTWHIGDGAGLSEMDLPSRWLLDPVAHANPTASFFIPRPKPDDVSPDESHEILVASERIERYLIRKRSEWEQARAAWRIGEFYGITIDLAFAIDAEPTITANYADRSATYNVETGQSNDGSNSLPPTARSLVERWLKERRDQILAQWQAAKAGEPIEMLEPLE